MKGKALLAGCIALAFSNMALAEDIKVAVVGAMSGPVAQYGDQEFTGAEPVSYTHLDVYKRQRLSSFRSGVSATIFR